MYDDAVFDKIFDLCFMADKEGFTSVADALELVLDVYLMEEAQLKTLANLSFKSRRHAEQCAEWVDDADQDTAHSLRQDSPAFGWSMSSFPLLQLGQSKRSATSAM